MKFSPLSRGRLLKRYKRFLADIELEDGVEMTIHCPNTGSMRHCAEPGYFVWFSDSQNPKRKYACTWELAEDFSGHLIGINTNNANKLVKEALADAVIDELNGYENVQSEVKYGDENSRIDFLLTHPEQPDCYVEVKSVTLLEEGHGWFPDAVSTRGQKHLRELMAMRERGHRAVLLFCVQHTGITAVSPAAQIDPDYGAILAEAVSAGVEVLVYGCEISSEEIRLSKALEFVP